MVQLTELGDDLCRDCRLEPSYAARKVVEHWDVLQVVPETSANDNSISRSGVHPHGGR